MVSQLVFTHRTFVDNLKADSDKPGHWWSDAWQQSIKQWRKLDLNGTSKRPDLTTEPLGLVTNEIRALAKTKQTQTRNLIAASTALALASAGVKVTPLQWVALPIFVYMGFPSARHLYEERQEEETLSATLELTALSMILIHGAVLPGAVAFSLYYLGRTLWAIHEEKVALHANDTLHPQIVCARRPTGNVTIPTTQIQPQEQIVYAAGDLIAVEGTIVDGIAWLQDIRDSRSLPDASPTVVKPNQTVTVGHLVLAGELIVECK